MPLEVIAESIRDAITPVFLLSGVATVLNVTTSRFSRIVDRYRELGMLARKSEKILAEMDIMYKRSRAIHWAIAAGTICALMVCLVVGVMFVGAELSFSPNRIISALFIAAMVTLIASLMLFLYEIHLATGTLETLKESHLNRDKKED